jgi:hypothetical protein
MDPILTKKKNCPKYEIFISPKVVHLLPFAAARVTSRAQTSMGPSLILRLHCEHVQERGYM